MTRLVMMAKDGNDDKELDDDDDLNAYCKNDKKNQR